MANTTTTANLQKFYNNIIRKKPLRFGYQFYIAFDGSIPSGDKNSNTIFSNENIGLWIKSSKIPAIDISSAKVNFFSAGFEVPGNIKYPDSWDVTILLNNASGTTTNEAMHLYTRLKTWMDEFSSYRASGGGKKVIPGVNAKVHLLKSDTMAIANTYIMERCMDF